MIPEIEFSPYSEIKKMQNEKLQQSLGYAAAKSPFYSDLFSKLKIDISKINIDNIGELPFTTKDDLTRGNESFFCVDNSKIIDYVTTSGTLGDPVTFALTEKDLQRLAYNEYISFICADGTRNDIYQLMCTLDRRFMAGLAYFMGIRRLGAGIIRVGNGLPELQWDTIKRMKPTTLVGVPSFILRMIRFAEDNGIDPSMTSVKSAVCIGENLRNADFSLNSLGRAITDKWGIKLYSTYASTEKAASFSECKAGRGGHLHPELLIAEIIKDDGRHAAEGETGELVFTTLGVEGMPLVRYRSGDLCQYFTDPCSCGRNTMRLGPIIGRKNHMIKYKGTTLYPPSVYDILDEISGIMMYYIEVYTGGIGTDEMMIHVAASADREMLEKKIKDKFRSKIRVTPSIIFESADTVRGVVYPENSRKAVKIIDRRS